MIITIIIISPLASPLPPLAGLSGSPQILLLLVMIISNDNNVIIVIIIISSSGIIIIIIIITIVIIIHNAILIVGHHPVLGHEGTVTRKASVSPIPLYLIPSAEWSPPSNAPLSKVSEAYKRGRIKKQQI